MLPLSITLYGQKSAIILTIGRGADLSISNCRQSLSSFKNNNYFDMEEKPAVIIHRHFKLYKPYGYLSQFVNNQNTRKNKKLLGELYNFPEDLMAIGRLDQDSEGLLLLTTNGKLSEEARSKKVEKEYYAQLDGTINEKALQEMEKGVEIGINGKKYLTQPCEVKRLDIVPRFSERGKRIRDDRHGPTSWISVTLTEGKFRQVRKMTAAVGFPTLRLVRVRIAHETLNQMEPGEVKAVDEFKLD